MSFAGNVLGGVTTPIFYKIEDNYCENPYFNEDTSGWVESTGGILTRINTDAEAYGEYMGRIQYSSDLQNVTFVESLAAAPANRTFLVSLRMKSQISGGQTVSIQFVDENSQTFGTNSFAVTEEARRYLIVALDNVPNVTSPYSVTLRIWGTEASGDSDLLFDHVYFTEVLSSISMPLPKVQSGEPDQIRFQKIVQGRNMLWDGNIQEFGKKWRPYYLGRYDYLSGASEIGRQQVNEASKVFVLPHSDVNWGFLGIWDGDFKRRYSFGRYIGHKGMIPIKGIEYVRYIPTEFAAGGVGVETLEV